MKETIWDSESAEKALKRKFASSWEATGVSIDTRTLEKGDLFVALQGEKTDGAKFIPEALAKGAVAVIEGLPELEKLAAFRRAESGARAAAVTGSVGKTSVKEMLAAALAAKGRVHASSGNYNNHIGLPLSLARMPMQAEYGVFELGMNHKGEIEALSLLARPHVSVITTIEAVHLEFFASVEEIALAKAEIFTGQQPGAFAVLPADSPYFALLAGKAKERGLKITSFGTSAAADFRLLSYENGLVKANFGEYEFHMPGRHMAVNSLAAIAAASALGEAPEKSSAALSALSPQKGRGERILKNGVLIIDDCYNASPASVKAALLALSDWKGKKIAVLGDMLELGGTAPAIHAALAEDIKKSGVDSVFTVGNLMENLYKSLPETLAAGHFKNSGEAAKSLSERLKKGDAVLIKGSNGMKMAQIVEGLKNAL